MGLCCSEDKKDEQKKLIDQPIDILEKLRNQVTIRMINHPTQKDYARLKLIERLLIMYKSDDEN